MTGSDKTMSLSGKAAIVTGARQGLGFAIASALAREGAAVTIADIDLDDCRQAAAKIEMSGGRALAVMCNVSQPEEVRDMVEKTRAAFGRVDILVNNAGYAVVKSFLHLSEDEWDRVSDINLKGPFLCAQAVCRSMIKNGGGRIINIASAASGGGGGCPPLMSSYVATKGGLKALSEAMAVELAAYGINVNTICPGTIDTGGLDEGIKEHALRVIPKGRLGQPEEIANMVLFLASEDSEYVTGGTFYVDGGVSRLTPGSR